MSNVIGKCGVFCGTCRLHVLTKCEGCLNHFAKSIKCSFYACVESKRLASCGECRQFPCLEHYGSSQVYSKKKLLNWKKKEIVERPKRN
ncbi:DUF3795 domain-containing protein [Candidatus Bathyarchaeota archaeon]|nr:DUF3795 domain-containing protein [Candidatus Bathyarchaeota archaeon]